MPRVIAVFKESTQWFHRGFLYRLKIDPPPSTLTVNTRFLCCGNPKSLASNVSKVFVYPSRFISFKYLSKLCLMVLDRTFFTFSQITIFGFHTPMFSIWKSPDMGFHGRECLVLNSTQRLSVFQTSDSLGT